MQDVIRLYAKEVARVLLKERGYFYVCGWVACRWTVSERTELAEVWGFREA